MTRIQTKVLVVGGGPAGSAAARALAAAGVEALVLEKDPLGVKPCGGGVPSGAFREFGLPESLARKRITALGIFPPTGSPYEVPLQHGYIGMVRREEFDRYLRDEARVEGAAFLKGDFLKLSAGDNGKIIAEVVTGGGPGRIESEYVVGADGVHSRVRASLALAPVPALYTLSGSVSAEAPRCEFHFGPETPGGYRWSFPGQGKLSIGLGSLAGRGLKDVFKRFATKFGLEPEGVRGYRIPLWEHSRNLVRGRVLLAGDSAGMVMPFTFEGIYYAISAGQMAAEAIIKGDPASYRKQWRGRFQMRFALMKQIWGRYLQDAGGMERLLNVVRNRGVQAGAMKLWLEKTYGRGSLLAFLAALRRFRLFRD